MGTEYYDFPEIDPSAKFNGANDINALAEGIDTAMKQVEVLGKEASYTLPAATATKLGGVRIGANVNVAADGTISTDVDPYVLPAASQTTLGGVMVPPNSGINLATDGTISIDDQSVTVSDNSVTTAKLTDKAVNTAKLADGAVTYEKCAQSLRTLIDSAEAYGTGSLSPYPENLFTRNWGDENTLKVYEWGLFIVLEFNHLDFTLTSDSDVITLITWDSKNHPSGGGSQYQSITAKLNDASYVGFLRTYNFYSYQELKLYFPTALTAGTYTIDGVYSVVYTTPRSS